MGGEKLYHPQHILEWEQAHPGKPLPLTILRDGKTIQLYDGTVAYRGVRGDQEQSG